MTFDAGIYPQFTVARARCLVDALGCEFFKGKTMLEVGCGYGYAGELFEKLGAVVSSLDGRKEHIDVVKKRYPKRKTYVMDMNKDRIPDWFDIVLAFGLLYHLEKPLHFIDQACRYSKTLCMCSIVCDSEESKLIPIEAEMGFDQSLTPKAYIPTPEWIKLTLESYGFDCKDVSSSAANAPGNRFDWESKNDGNHGRNGYYLRRMYVAQKHENAS